MSTLTADPQFGRGHTLGGGFTLKATDGNNVVGAAKIFTDTDPHTGVVFTNRDVRCVALRNKHTDPLLPGQLVAFNLDEVTGLAAAGDPEVGVVDEYLPASGVRVDDVFWAIVAGPTAIVTAAAVAKGDTLAVGAGGEADAGVGLGVALGEPEDGKVRALVGVHYTSAVVVS